LLLISSVALLVVHPSDGEQQATSAPRHGVESVQMANVTQTVDITAIGDSTMLEADDALFAALLPRQLAIDAVGGRTVPTTIKAIRDYRRRHQLGSTVVVTLANDTPVSRRGVGRLLAALRDVPQVVMVNVAPESPWKADVNEALAARAAAYPNVRLVDWNAYARANPGLVDWDGSLESGGPAALSALIVSAIR
jgi:hypothetical protein